MPPDKGGDCESKPQCAQQLARGIRDYQQRRFIAAVTSFEKAYLLSSDPRLLIMMGRSWYKLGDTVVALEYYTRTRKQLTVGADQDRLEQYIAEAREEARLPLTTPLPARQTAATHNAAPELSLPADALSTLSSPGPSIPLDLRPSPAPPPVASGGKPMKAWMWAVIGVTTAAVVGTAVGLGVGYRSGSPTPDTTVRFP